MIESGFTKGIHRISLIKHNKINDSESSSRLHRFIPNFLLWRFFTYITCQTLVAPCKRKEALLRIWNENRKKEIFRMKIGKVYEESKWAWSIPLVQKPSSLCYRSNKNSFLNINPTFLLGLACVLKDYQTEANSQIKPSRCTPWTDRRSFLSN